MATRKRNEKDHAAKKNPGSAEFYKKQRHERNMARGPQSKLEVAAPEGNYAIRKRD
jgi:hypothetical protein